MMGFLARQRQLEERIEFLEGVVDRLLDRPIPTGVNDIQRARGYGAAGRPGCRGRTAALAALDAAQDDRNVRYLTTNPRPSRPDPCE